MRPRQPSIPKTNHRLQPSAVEMVREMEKTGEAVEVAEMDPEEAEPARVGEEVPELSPEVQDTPPIHPKPVVTVTTDMVQKVGIV